MKTLIADTNIFYNLGWNKLQVNSLVGSGERLCYSPVSVLELAGKISPLNHADRKAAANAIIASNAQELPDPESFLTLQFGYPLADPPASFSDVVKAMAQSSNMGELLGGVPDWTEGVSRRVSVTTAAAWRQVAEDAWYSDMIALMRKEIPGFGAWYDDPIKRQKKRVPALTGDAETQFLDNVTTPSWTAQLLLACQTRSFKRADPTKVPNPPTKQTVANLYHAIDKVHCYGCVYTQYLVRLLTDRALPDANDSGDLELFLYSIDDDHVIVTCEKKWKRLAEAAGFGNRVKLITI